jgi:hypothetical protein
MEAKQSMLRRFQLYEMNFNAIQNGFNRQECILNEINLC